VLTLPAKLAIDESQLSVQVSIADHRHDEIIAARRQLLQLIESEPA
jgi:hypothetical protein